MTTTATLNQDLEILLVVEDEPTLPVRTRLSYSGLDPLAVTMTFMTAERGVRWTFARDLLFEGMRRPVGEGDVHVHPRDEAVRLALHSPSGKAEFVIDPFDLAVFLDETQAVVPRGSEIDAADLERAVELLVA